MSLWCGYYHWKQLGWVANPVSLVLQQSPRPTFDRVDSVAVGGLIRSRPSNCSLHDEESPISAHLFRLMGDIVRFCRGRLMNRGRLAKTCYNDAVSTRSSPHLRPERLLWCYWRETIPMRGSSRFANSVPSKIYPWRREVRAMSGG